MTLRIHLQAAWRAVALALLALAAVGAAAATPEVLHPEQAFRYEAAAEGSDIVVRWTIEPGYYLYRERMSFAAKTAGVTLGPAVLPAGIPYHDEFFGDMHIFRGRAEVRLPVLEAGARTAELEIRSQGCADIGLCYPPQTWTARVALAGVPPGPPRSGLAGLLEGPDADAPLPPASAFRVSATLVTPELLRVTWDVAPGYYLYRDSIGVASLSPGVTLGAPSLPPGIEKEDEYFGLTEVYYGQAVAELAASGGAEPLQVRVTHQGCKEDSICYPVQTVMLTVDTAGPAAGGFDGTDAAAPMVSEQDRLAGLIGSANLALVMLSFAGFGLLLSFTPCCLPMVPILSGIIVGQGKHVTTGRAFLLSLTYVLGMAVTYTAAGAAFAAAGQQIQAALQQPAIIIGVAALFVALALSMFGLYELQLPAPIMSRLTAASGRQRAGTYLGTAVMGALSALIVTTCVAPPLVAALTVIAHTGDTLRGALALFALSIGMGLPLLALGASAGRLLPKAGAWMSKVKGAFGFLMLGLAVWMLDRILADGVTMLLWAVLVFLAGVFLGAFQPLDARAPVTAQLAKGLGLLAAIYGGALLVGALAGGRDPLQPLQAFQVQAAREETRLPFRRIKTVAELDQAITSASAAGRPVMLDFYADWCASCLEMERYTFPNAEVRAALASAARTSAFGNV
jgi:thiol:disulfide interchange protein DsbD